MMDGLERASFFTKFPRSEEAFEKSGLEWNQLVEIFHRHSASIPNLEPTAAYIADRLRYVPEVHSLKYRIKDPEHLIEKIIRKKVAKPDLDVTPDNYSQQITDLIGIRALHLFKEDWSLIHDFISDTWDLDAAPTANVRKGDPEELLEVFRSKGCEIHEHPYGYRSVHYLVVSKPSKDTSVAELQVRTIFEEGWSEIDHRLRYPYNVDDALLAQFLVIFNRLAGSADEMGSFTRLLRAQIQFTREQHELKLKEKEEAIAKLKEEIGKLRIPAKDKKQLAEGIDELATLPVASASLESVRAFEGARFGISASLLDKFDLISRAVSFSPEIAALGQVEPIASKLKHTDIITNLDWGVIGTRDQGGEQDDS